MKHTTSDSPAIAAVCDKHGPDAASMEAYLNAHAPAARWVAPRDLDDVDRDVIAGRVQTVVFVRWQALLEGIWNGEVTFTRWQEMTAQVRFVESPGTDGQAQLATISQAWTQHKRARRRSQAISGLILSVIAIASAFVLIHP